MAETGGRLGLYIFILVFNIVFPVLSYTFTGFEAEFGDFDVSLDMDTLMMAGINFVDAESDNLTYNGPWAYFEVQNKTTRFRYMDDVRDPWWVIVGDGIATQRQSPGAKARESWDSTYRISVKGAKAGNWLKAIWNSTIISEWNIDYNWSRFMLNDGTNLFITPFSGNNITKAVYEDGKLNLTVAKTFEQTTNFNFWQFISWYASLMLGTQAWGLPPIFGWIIKIFSAISILALILLTKEMIRL